MNCSEHDVLKYHEAEAEDNEDAALWHAVHEAGEQRKNEEQPE